MSDKVVLVEVIARNGWHELLVRNVLRKTVARLDVGRYRNKAVGDDLLVFAGDLNHSHVPKHAWDPETHEVRSRDGRVVGIAFPELPETPMYPWKVAQTNYNHFAKIEGKAE